MQKTVTDEIMYKPKTFFKIN